MTSQTADKVLPPQPRFHLPKDDGFYQPIHFMFVSEQMHLDIVDERRAILDALPPALRVEQAKLFAHYDPHAHAKAFRDILRMFGVAAHA